MIVINKVRNDHEKTGLDEAGANGAKVPNSVPLDLERTAQSVECASAVEDQVVAIFNFQGTTGGSTEYQRAR